MTTRILLVDDQRLFREGVATLLALHEDLEIVGEAADGHEAVECARALRPDVVLMDLRMPRLDGVEATRRIRRELPAVQVIALTTFDEDESVFAALRAGAVGYLLKDSPSAQLAEAVRAAARGESFLQPTVASKVVAEFVRLRPHRARGNQSLPEPLSGRELEILEHLAAGRSNREIAEHVHLAEGTVKNHVTQILAKLDAPDRTRAALKARELGLVRDRPARDDAHPLPVP